MDDRAELLVKRLKCSSSMKCRNNNLGLHEVVQEVLIAVLVARLSEIVLSHDIVVGMISLPGQLLALLGHTGLFLALRKSAMRTYERGVEFK